MYWPTCTRAALPACTLIRGPPPPTHAHPPRTSPADTARPVIITPGITAGRPARQARQALAGQSQGEREALWEGAAAGPKAGPRAR